MFSVTDRTAPKAVTSTNESHPKLSEENLRELTHKDVLVSAAFAKVVSIMMQSPLHKHYSLADLEWMAMPPVLLGQFAMLDRKTERMPLAVPVAAALWAKVSSEVDRRLSTQLDRPIYLRPDEWQSGDILWLVDVIGPQQAASALIIAIRDRLKPGVKMRLRHLGSDAKLEVTNI